MGTTVKLEEIAEWATIEGPFKLKNHVDFYSGGYYIGTVKNSGGGCNETDKANAALITHYLKEFPKLLGVKILFFPLLVLGQEDRGLS